MSRIRKKESKVERSCASKRMKMNARATSWVTHGGETFFLQKKKNNTILSQTCAMHSQSLALHKLQTHTLTENVQKNSARANHTDTAN